MLGRQPYGVSELQLAFTTFCFDCVLLCIPSVTLSMYESLSRTGATALRFETCRDYYFFNNELRVFF